MKDIWNTKSLLNIIKTIIISPEFGFLLLMYLIKYLKIIPFDDIANKIFKDTDMVKDTVKWFTLGFPCLIFAAALKLHHDLQLPENNNKILYKWPDYNIYLVTTYIGLLYCALPILPTSISVFYFSTYQEYDTGFYYVLLLGISIISIISLYSAKFKVKRIIQELS
jgi:hypothetical protein